MARVSGKLDAEAHLERLGHAVRTMRKTRGLSQETLADAAGIDRSHMGRIERGERNLTILNLIRIASAMDVTPSQIMAAAGL